ncbi:MAG: hypothetical protein JRF72_20290 [Deltaproteobacteria bacterium]|jgi:DNA-binding transcriptional regulator GbsR (MarR family)|nr:hypothetical protein [Deltaproteobacteria bacterium]
MQDKADDFYSNAHLTVAAIRICEHRNSTPPSLEEICDTLSFSIEKVSLILRRLKEMDIIDVVKGSYGDRFFIRDHLKLEDIPRGQEENKLEEELKKFQDTQKALSQKVESFKAEQAKKKKDLFSEMEKKLKAELEKKSK